MVSVFNFSSPGTIRKKLALKGSQEVNVTYFEIIESIKCFFATEIQQNTIFLYKYENNIIHLCKLSNLRPLSKQNSYKMKFIDIL